MLDLLEVIGLTETAHQLPRELPEGMRKLVDIAMALALRPRLIFMDEPTSGVSTREKFAIMDVVIRALQHNATTAVFVEHDMEVVSRYADRVAVWSFGRIGLRERRPRFSTIPTSAEVLWGADMLRLGTGVGRDRRRRRGSRRQSRHSQRRHGRPDWPQRRRQDQPSAPDHGSAETSIGAARL